MTHRDGSPVRLVFLGTGAAGGTPGAGRSRRAESSLLISGRVRVLVDVTRHFLDQAPWLDSIDAIVLTHAHADAAGGFARLRQWWRAHGRDPIPVLGHPTTLRRVAEKFRRLDHVVFQPLQPGQARSVHGWMLTGIEVPHDRRPTYPTMAWRLEADGRSVVYASDLARPTSTLATLCRGAHALVLDGATWRRRIYSHLRIDEDLSAVCGWDVGRIWLTQIGRSAPPHDELATLVAQICPRAAPAHDGLAVRL